MRFLSIILLLMAGLCACTGPDKNRRVIVVQPLAAFPKEEAETIIAQIKSLGATVVLNDNLPVPKSFYYSPGKRYRADSLIRFLKTRVGKDSIIVGILNEDISTTKDGIPDWGVMGLGYRPGNSCVVSSFRINKNKRAEQLYKVIVHEIGHTEGLDHCPEKTCLMRDAAGGNPLDEEKNFCERCKAHLERKGWGA
ncbi:MAG: matrixin family metalloprotease [Sphingobacteriales bacterium]|nr:MAG: matrixin family metalloprotease [Sphingobacteriales bacterium]